jgi:uncharacterized protein
MMPSMPSNHRLPQLPLGTQVVLREPVPDKGEGTAQRGATGRILEVTGDARYVVRFADGRQAVVRREQVSLRRSYQQELTIGTEGRPEEAGRLVREHTIYAAVVGSRAFGLATDESDTDTRGVYVAPTSAFWSLSKPPMHVEGPEPEWFSWEVERFCELALKANPNLLEVLHSPRVVHRSELGEELLELREAFLSQLAYQTYSGYVLSQFTKLEADLRQRGAPKWKHVMHLIRLLLSAQELLSNGRLMVDVGEHRDRLIAVRRGELSWEQVEQLRLGLHRGLDDALAHSPLPAVPDVARVDDWLRSVRRRNVIA